MEANKITFRFFFILAGIFISSSLFAQYKGTLDCSGYLLPEISESLLSKKDVYVVVVAGYSSGGDIAPTLRSKGFNNIIHIRPQIDAPAIIAGAHNPQNYIENIIYDGNFETLVQKLSSKKIVAVFAGTETGVELTDKLTDRLKLVGNTPKLSEARRNKYKMHQLLKSSKIASIDDILSSDLTEIIRWTKNRSYPLVVKPVDSAASQGVHVCSNEQQVSRAFHDLMNQKNLFDEPIKEVLVQEYLEGDEYVVNMVYKDGKPIVGEVIQYEKETIVRPDGSVTKRYRYDELKDPTSAISKELIEYALKVNEAMEIKQGPSHMEIMYTKRGPVLIENGARLMGGHTQLAMREAADVSLLDLNIMAYLWPKQFEEFFKKNKVFDENYAVLKRKKFVRNIQLVSSVEGVVERVNHIEEMKKNISSLWFVSMATVGDKVSKTIDLVTSPGNIWLLNDDEEVLNKDYETIKKLYEPTFFTVKSSD